MIMVDGPPNLLVLASAVCGLPHFLNDLRLHVMMNYDNLRVS